MNDCRCLCHRMDYVGAVVSNGETTRFQAGLHESYHVRGNLKPWPERRIAMGYSFDVRHSRDTSTWCCDLAVRVYADKVRVR